MCNYTGYDFGAYYKDSVCIDGYLFDADSWDGKGYTVPGVDEEQIRCPRCNKGIRGIAYKLFHRRWRHETGTSIAEVIMFVIFLLYVMTHGFVSGVIVTVVIVYFTVLAISMFFDD